MRHLKVIVCFLLYSLIAHGKADINQIRLSVEQLERGLKAKEPTVDQKCLAADFSIHIYSRPFAFNMLRQIMGGVNFESVELINSKLNVQGNVTYATVRMLLEGGKEEKSVVAFNSSAQIVFVDYFDRLFGDSRYQKTLLVAEIPFRMERGAIILQARLNGSSRQMSFLLDTGADGMALRRSLADSIGLKGGRAQEANVVGGRKTIEVIADNTLHLSDSFAVKGQSIALFDEIRKGTDGIIGLNLIRKYITEINFDQETLSFYKFGDYQFSKRGYSIPVSVPGLVVLTSALNLTGAKEISGHFIVDTGANYYLIAFSRFVRQNRLLLSGFKPEGNGTTVSLGHSTPVYHGHAKALKVGGLTEKNIPVTLQASTGNDISAANGVDGSVGILLFSRHNVTIDLLRKVVHLSPRAKK